jgi:hypothetical protein
MTHASRAPVSSLSRTRPLATRDFLIRREFRDRSPIFGKAADRRRYPKFDFGETCNVAEW